MKTHESEVGEVGKDKSISGNIPMFISTISPLEIPLYPTYMNTTDDSCAECDCDAPGGVLTELRLAYPTCQTPHDIPQFSSR